MSDDLVSLRILIVSDNASERDVLRTAALQAPVVIDVSEVDVLGGAAGACKKIASEKTDIVFLDSRMSHENRRSIVDAARAAGARPIVISMGAINLKASEAAAERQLVDGMLAKPVTVADARALLDACVRARLPSRVLVVDDSPTMRSVIRKVLQSCRSRFQIEEAADGTSALQLAAKQRFDLVLLDHNMPGLDGFATLAMFMQSYADVKVVVITATNNTKIADRARAAGAHDVLYKPFYAQDIDALMNRLYGLMRAKSG
jgi:CheY-like chemotaxis protein